MAPGLQKGLCHPALAVHSLWYVYPGQGIEKRKRKRIGECRMLDTGCWIKLKYQKDFIALINCQI